MTGSDVTGSDAPLRLSTYDRPLAAAVLRPDHTYHGAADRSAVAAQHGRYVATRATQQPVLLLPQHAHPFLHPFITTTATTATASNSKFQFQNFRLYKILAVIM